MEKDDEVSGAGNHIDYGARGRDPRLGGGWWSVDPLAAKYPHISPYAAFANNPIIYVDNDGRENIIYLLVLPSSNTTLKKGDAQKIANQATANFQSMGLKTEVRIVDATKFDISKIDGTDAVAVIGSKNEVTSYVKNTLKDAEFGETLEKRWSGGGNNPETSENSKNNNPANIIAIDADGLNSFGDKIASPDDKEKAVKAGALSINHGAGHNSGLNHSDGDLVDNDAPVMKKASGISSYSRNNGYPKVFDKAKNADYVKSMKARFSDNKATDNYSKRTTPKKR